MIICIIQSITVQFTDSEVSYFNALNLSVKPELWMIKTEMFEKLSDVINRVRNGTANAREKNGLIIYGPKGTGKSWALFYLKHILKDEIVLFLSPHQEKKYLEESIRKFMPSDGKFVVLKVSY